MGEVSNLLMVRFVFVLKSAYLFFSMLCVTLKNNISLNLIDFFQTMVYILLSMIVNNKFKLLTNKYCLNCGYYFLQKINYCTSLFYLFWN